MRVPPLTPQTKMQLRLQPSGLRQSSIVISMLRSSLPCHTTLCLRLQRRSITADEKPLPERDTPGAGPNQEQLPHVSEEAAATGKITGEGGPDIEQGTPVQEILQRDKGSQDKAPKIMQEEMKQSTPKGSRKFSTSALRLRLLQEEWRKSSPKASRQFSTYPKLRQEVLTTSENQAIVQGHYFDLPALPLPPNSNLKHRYDPIVKQFTNLMMRDGKLSKAQRNMAVILRALRTATPPTINPLRPLIDTRVPSALLPLDPIRYLTLIIDSVAPLMRIRSQKGAAGGGVALQIPVPLGLKQRRRMAVMWILDAASKKRSKGSGHDMFAQKVADELLAVAEGKSGVWERRVGIHKIGVSTRANLKFRTR